jgi:chromosome segregation protein
MIVRTSTWFLLAGVPAVLSCSSTPWDRDDADPVDAAYLMDISADDREEIATLRASEAELQDQRAFCERELEGEKADKEVARQELDVAQQEVEEAEARIEAARTDDDVEEARERASDTKRHVAWAEAQIGYHDARIDWQEAKCELAERRIDLAAARTERRKAEAVQDIEDRPTPDYDLTAYDEAIMQAELAVRLAEIETNARAKKAEAYRETMDNLASDIPEDRRASWRSSPNEPIEEIKIGDKLGDDADD